MVLQQGSLHFLVRGTGGQIPNKVHNFLPMSGWWGGVKHHVKFLLGVTVPHQRGCGEVFSEVYLFVKVLM